MIVSKGKVKHVYIAILLKTASLNDDVDDILNTYPVPEAKSLTQVSKVLYKLSMNNIKNNTKSTFNESSN